MCYSFHSSYEEIQDIVSYLSPRRVFANVIPMGDCGAEVKKRLDSILSAEASEPTDQSQLNYLGVQIKRSSTVKHFFLFVLIIC